MAELLEDAQIADAVYEDSAEAFAERTILAEVRPASSPRAQDAEVFERLPWRAFLCYIIPHQMTHHSGRSKENLHATLQ